LRLDKSRLDKVKLRAHLNLYNNETSEICHWHINAAHYLESWGDARAYDGTAMIVQPLIQPLYEGKTAYEVLALFSDNYDTNPYDIVRSYWSEQQHRQLISAVRPQFSTQPTVLNSPTDFESWWRKCLHDGFIPNTALAAKLVTAKSGL